MSPTFSGNLGKNRCRNTDDVTRNYVREHNKENPKKIGESHKAVERQRNEIPVDNLEFSTFSTGFSTRVFHMEKEWKNGVVINSGRHNLFRLPSTKFYFSGAVHFDQWDLPGRKKALDKEFEEKLKIF